MKLINFSRRMVIMSSIALILAGCQYDGVNKPATGNTGATWVATCEDWDQWDKPGPPFQIYGNSYYVGTCGIASILITGDQGHVLIDGGTEAGAAVIAANINSLGFELTDVKILLHSHEHFDHVAGLAKIQQLSGAKLLASPKAAPVLNTGEVADDDPQSGVTRSFPPAKVGGLVNDGEAVQLGDLKLLPIATPGHTTGALSWQWQSCKRDRCLNMVYADSLSPISADDYQFSNHPEYVTAYKNGLNKLAELNCQILLTPHPTASQMRDRLSSTKGLIDSSGCQRYAQSVLHRLEKRLTDESKTFP